MGRSEILAAIFFLLAVLTYQKATRSEARHFTRSVIWVSVTILLAAVSLLCKEQGITVLGLLFACDILSAVKTGRRISQKDRQRYVQSCITQSNAWQMVGKHPNQSARRKADLPCYSRYSGGCEAMVHVNNVVGPVYILTIFLSLVASILFTTVECSVYFFYGPRGVPRVPPQISK